MILLNLYIHQLNFYPNLASRRINWESGKYGVPLEKNLYYKISQTTTLLFGFTISQYLR